MRKKIEANEAYEHRDVCANLPAVLYLVLADSFGMNASRSFFGRHKPKRFWLHCSRYKIGDVPRHNFIQLSLSEHGKTESKLNSLSCRQSKNYICAGCKLAMLHVLSLRWLCVGRKTVTITLLFVGTQVKTLYIHTQYPQLGFQPFPTS